MDARKSNNSLWHAVPNPESNRDEWKPREDYAKRWYAKLSKQEKELEGSVYYVRTRIQPREYYKREIEKQTKVVSGL